MIDIYSSWGLTNSYLGPQQVDFVPPFPVALEDEEKVRDLFEWAKENSTLVGCQGRREGPQRRAFPVTTKWHSARVRKRSSPARHDTRLFASPAGRNFVLPKSPEGWWLELMGASRPRNQWMSDWWIHLIWTSPKSRCFFTPAVPNKNWASPKIHRTSTHGICSGGSWGPRPFLGTARHVCKRSEAYSLSSRVASWWFHQRSSEAWSMYVPSNWLETSLRHAESTPAQGLLLSHYVETCWNREQLRIWVYQHTRTGVPLRLKNPWNCQPLSCAQRLWDTVRESSFFVASRFTPCPNAGLCLYWFRRVKEMLAPVTSSPSIPREWELERLRVRAWEIVEVLNRSDPYRRYKKPWFVWAVGPVFFPDVGRWFGTTANLMESASTPIGDCCPAWFTRRTSPMGILFGWLMAPSNSWWRSFQSGRKNPRYNVHIYIYMYDMMIDRYIYIVHWWISPKYNIHISLLKKFLVSNSHRWSTQNTEPECLWSMRFSGEVL